MNVRSMRYLGAALIVTLLMVLSGTAVLAQETELDETQGALVVAVISGSPASAAGIVRGDMIMSVDDQGIGSSADLRGAVQEAAPGDIVTLTVRHGDEEYTVDVELGDVGGRAFLGVYLARDLADSASEEPAADEAAPEESEAEEAEGAETDAESEPAAPEAGEAAAGEAEEGEEAETEGEAAAPEADDAAAAEAEEGEESETEGEAESQEAAPAEEEPAAPMEPDAYGMTPLKDIAAGALVFGVLEDSPAEEAGIGMGDVILGIDGERFAQIDDLAESVDGHAPGDAITLEVLRHTGALEEVIVTLGEHPEREGKAFLGIRYLPTPRRLFLGHSEDGDVLVPRMPFHHFGPGDDGSRQWWPRMQPRYHPWMPHECDGDMPWCDDAGDDEDDDAGIDEDTAPDANGGDNAYSPAALAA